MESFLDFIRNWGYWAVFLGSLVEGESVILTASALAYSGYLNIYKVALIAFTGTLVADQGLYMLGRKYGDAVFQKYPKLKASSQKAFDLLHRYDSWFILTFRFIYGVRVAGSVVIGASGVSPRRFIPLNILSAVIWATISCAAGYHLGEVILHVFEYIETIQKFIFYLGIPAAILVAWMIWKRKKPSA